MNKPSSLLYGGLIWLSCSACEESRELRVMTFNIEYGGTVVDFERVIEAAELADADVIGLEEPYANAGLLAEALGFPYVNARTDVISRYPIIDPPGANGRYVYVEVEPGKVAAISNVHLPSDPYGPYLTMEGAAVEEVLELERELRLPALTPFLNALGPLIAQQMPVFLLGDFNSPSHLDWTPETVGLRPQITYPVAWPVTVAAEAAGLRDSYREVYSDPKRYPGLTWWAARPGIHDDFPETDPQDRIDLVFSGGAARAKASEIVGEAGALSVDLPVDPWPSDHRGVVSTFDIVPTEMPVLVAVEERLLERGAKLRARFKAPGKKGERVLVFPSAGAANQPSLPAVSTGRKAPELGALSISTSTLAPGAYQLALVSGSNDVLSQTPFWVKAPGASTELALDKTEYGSGEPISVSFRNAPGNRWDWVAVYPAPADPDNDDYLIWSYVDAAIEGAVTLDQSSAPLEPGSYEVAFLLYDAYEVAALAAFTVSD